MGEERGEVWSKSFDVETGGAVQAGQILTGKELLKTSLPGGPDFEKNRLQNRLKRKQKPVCRVNARGPASLHNCFSETAGQTGEASIPLCVLEMGVRGVGCPCRIAGRWQRI